MHIPVNRWTVLAALAVASLLGGDFVTAMAKVIGILSAPYVPAM
jgi:hypothetical protein